MTLADIEDGRRLRMQSYVEDGSRLAPMHRFHDPGGALVATLPQWPRMNSKLVRSIDRPRSFNLLEYDAYRGTITP